MIFLLRNIWHLFSLCFSYAKTLSNFSLNSLLQSEMILTDPHAIIRCFPLLTHHVFFIICNGIKKMFFNIICVSVSLPYFSFYSKLLLTFKCRKIFFLILSVNPNRSVSRLELKFTKKNTFWIFFLVVWFSSGCIGRSAKKIEGCKNLDIPCDFPWKLCQRRVLSHHHHDFSCKADAKDHYCSTERGKISASLKDQSLYFTRQALSNWRSSFFFTFFCHITCVFTC